MKPYCLFCRVIRTVLIISVFFFTAQCKKNRSSVIDPAFTEKIAAFTSGVISSESTIQVVLADDYPGQITRNTPVNETIFKFSPDIPGHTVWIDNRTIEFRPEHHLVSGQDYSAKFYLSKLMKVPRNISVLEFEFSVVPQAFSVDFEGYQTKQENDLVWNSLKGVVNTSDFIDGEILASYFEARQGKEKLKIIWDNSVDRRTFQFTIDSVKRTEEPGKVELSWDATAQLKGLKGTGEFEMPALGDFKIMDVKVIQQPEQYIQIMFSDPLRKKQNFEGLVTLGKDVGLNYTVEGNILKVYPAVRQSGDDNLSIQEGIENVLGYPLKAPYAEIITFELAKPQVRLLGKGVILPSTKGLIFPFEAVNLNAVDVKIIKIFENNVGYFLQINNLDGSNQLKRAGRLVHKQTVLLNHEPVDLGKWNRFYLDLEKLIQPDPGAIYRIEISFRKSYSLYYCGGEQAEKIETPDPQDEEEDMEQEISYWDSYQDYYYEYYDEGDYYEEEYEYDERDNPCSSSYYRQNRWVARNILASDLGIIAKAGEGSLFCAVTNLVSTEPISNAAVTVLNYQQQPIAKGVTDKEGFVNFDIKKEKAFLVIAQSDKQRGYLRVDDGSSLSLGAFDVSGDAVKKGLKGFIYGERGVWRPGDTLFINFILEDKQKVLPSSHPVIFELYNPQGQLYSRHVKSSGINGFYSMALPTAQDVPTGNWNLKVKAGGIVFDKIVKIETVKPNRLKINLTFPVTKLSASTQDVTGNLSVIWLQGATARNLKAQIDILLTNETTSFAKYDAYQFTDYSKSFSSAEETLFEGNTDENGKAVIPTHIKAGTSAPGMLKANFTVRVFEKGGDFSIDRFSMVYSPYTSYVGIKVPAGDRRGMLLTDTIHWADVVTLDDDGKPISRNGLEVTVYKLDWRSWWEYNGDALASFMGNTYRKPVIVKNVSTLNGKGRFSFRIDRPEWGQFYIRVNDPVSGHSTGQIVNIDWPGWAGRPMRDNPEAASMLTFNSDKKKYAVGEEAELIVPTGGEGRLLLSIESGSRIISRQWIPVQAKETKVKFPVTADMAPNVYAHVTLIQPHANTVNDMPMRLYGVIPIFVEDPGTRLEPVLKMPDVLEPLQQFTIQVSEKNRKQMTYTIAIVEEGLLDLTRFKTPDPWSRFYAREALGVKTWDLYDMVIGAFGGKLSSIIGIGGDNDLVSKESADKANRFKPVVTVLGPFTLGAGSTNSHNVKLPNYIGSVKAMLVAGQDGAYGNTDKAVPVKKPLMVLATLPRVMGPGESVKLPVTVFAMDKQVKDVQVQVKANDFFLPGETRVKKISFQQQGDQMVDFDLKTASKLGVARVKVIATSGKLVSEYDVEMDVRASNPPVTTFISGGAESNKNWESDFTLPGMEGTNSAILEVSAVLPMDAGRRLKYLIQYPYGCIEQTTSTAFAQLYLDDIMEMNNKFKMAIDEHIKYGIKRISTFQLSDGSFSYWPGQQYYDNWATSYAGHFLIEAESKGYVLPAGLKSSWIKAQRQNARQWRPASLDKRYYYYQDDLEQAYRLFTLALAGAPETGAMNKLKEMKDISVQARWRLAAAYALAGQVQVAKDLIARETTEISPYKGTYSSYGSAERDWAMILETLVILNDRTRGMTVARKVSDKLSSNYWMSTQTTAYTMLALAKFSKGITTKKMGFTYSVGNGKEVLINTVKPSIQIPLTLPKNSQTGHIVVKNNNPGLLFTRVIMEGIPEKGNEEDFNNQISLDVSYRTSDGDPLDVSSITQGTDFYATVTVYNSGDFDYRQLALTQIFPPGWEISNSRIADVVVPGQNNYTYQDIRDDRVNTFFDLSRGERKTFKVLLNASYIGTFYLPGVYCEAMYDNTVSALKKGREVSVVNP
jgi:alpha-2-macroglobulin